MSKEEAKRQFDDVQKFESPDVQSDHAVRCVDEEAGVVLYAMGSIGMDEAGLGLSAVPLSDTTLNE